MSRVTDGIGMESEKDCTNLADDRPTKRIANESELIKLENTSGDAMNALALRVLRRVEKKLSGIICNYHG